MRKAFNLFSFFFVVFSFIGLVLFALLVNSVPSMRDSVSWRKPLLGTASSLIFVLGIFAGIRPSKCSAAFHFKRRKFDRLGRESGGSPKNPLALSGHHPECGYFSAHVFHTDGKVLCAGCTGLILGAAFSLAGTIPYFFFDLSFLTDYHLVFWAGFIGVSCGLLQYHLFNWGRSSVHLFINTFFVLGTFLLLVGADAITQNVAVGLYLIVLSVFWIYVRILLSELDHRKICSICQTKECTFFRDRQSLDTHA